MAFPLDSWNLKHMAGSELKLLFIQRLFKDDMGGCQNYDPFLGTLNIRGRIV